MSELSLTPAELEEMFTTPAVLPPHEENDSRAARLYPRAERATCRSTAFLDVAMHLGSLGMLDSSGKCHDQNLYHDGSRVNRKVFGAGIGKNAQPTQAFVAVNEIETYAAEDLSLRNVLRMMAYRIDFRTFTVGRTKLSVVEKEFKADVWKIQPGQGPYILGYDSVSVQENSNEGVCLIKHWKPEMLSLPVQEGVTPVGSAEAILSRQYLQEVDDYLVELNGGDDTRTWRGLMMQSEL